MNARRAFLLLSSLTSFLPLLACTASLDGRTGTQQQPSTGGSCAQSIAEYCTATSCLTGWQSADEVCMSSDPGALEPVRFSTTCGDYLALSQPGGTSYFDASNSGLVAIVDANGQCLAGPSDFVVPAAESCPLVVCSMQDCGGPDAGPPNAEQDGGVH